MRNKTCDPTPRDVHFSSAIDRLNTGRCRGERSTNQARAFPPTATGRRSALRRSKIWTQASATVGLAEEKGDISNSISWFGLSKQDEQDFESRVSQLSSAVIIHLILAPQRTLQHPTPRTATGDNPIRSDYVFSPPKFRGAPAAATVRNNVSFISAAMAASADTAAARNVNWILIDAENNPLLS